MKLDTTSDYPVLEGNTNMSNPIYLFGYLLTESFLLSSLFSLLLDDSRVSSVEYNNIRNVIESI
jgi:membrane-anchored glycerophosphoryl diester phosphodiesterase (GDPDase)